MAPEPIILDFGDIELLQQVQEKSHTILENIILGHLTIEKSKFVGNARSTNLELQNSENLKNEHLETWNSKL